MKNVQQQTKRRAGILGLVCLLAVSLSSCLKENNNDNTPLPDAALLSVINTSPDSGPLDFYLEPNRANNQPIYYGFGIDYIRASVGKRTATFRQSGSNTIIKSDTLTLVKDKAYSLFLINAVATPELFLLRDTIAQPAANTASVRFLNLSTDAPAADLAIQGGTTLVTNRGYKGYSSFIAVPAANNASFEIRRAGTTTVLATITNVDLRAGSVYTVWLQGLASATDVKQLKGRVQLNAYY